MGRAIIYGRQSRTKDGSESLATQDQACTEACQRLEHTVVARLFEPPSTSAFKQRGLGRPEWARLLHMIRHGQADLVMTYRSDRLSRGGGPGWAPLLEAAEAAGLNLDRFVATPSGFMSELEIGIRATMDREEAKKISERAVDAQARRAAAGKPNKGGRRPFGYTVDREIVPGEADLIVSAARRVLAGVSVRTIAAEWNTAGVLTPAGNRWRHAAVRRVFLSPNAAGNREYRGTIIKGTWTPILDEVTHRALRARLADHSPSWSRARKYLLVGLIRCGVCDTPLITVRRDGYHRYRCPTPKDGGCGGVSIHGPRVDLLARDLAAYRMGSPAFAQAQVRRREQPTARLSVEAERLRAKQADLVGLWRDDLLTRDEYTVERRRLDVQLANINEQLNGTVVPLVGDGRSLLDRWEEWSVEERRARLASIVECFVVGRASVPGGGWQPRRVRPRWRR